MAPSEQHPKVTTIIMLITINGHFNSATSYLCMGGLVALYNNIKKLDPQLYNGIKTEHSFTVTLKTEHSALP